MAARISADEHVTVAALDERRNVIFNDLFEGNEIAVPVTEGSHALQPQRLLGELCILQPGDDEVAQRRFTIVLAQPMATASGAFLGADRK